MQVVVATIPAIVVDESDSAGTGGEEISGGPQGGWKRRGVSNQRIAGERRRTEAGVEGRQRFVEICTIPWSTARRPNWASTDAYDLVGKDKVLHRSTSCDHIANIEQR